MSRKNVEVEFWVPCMYYSTRKW